MKLVDSDQDWEKKILLSAAIEGAAERVTADLFQGYLESMGNGKIDPRIRKALDIVLKRL